MLETEPKPATTGGSEFLAGGALGALVGMLLGMSTAPIVGTLMTGLVALMASFFGFGSALLPRGGPTTKRLVGFCIAAVIATILGVLARTHDTLSPPTPPKPSPETIQAFVSELRDLKFPESKIYDFVAIKYFGVLPNGNSLPQPTKTDDTSRTKLFASAGDDCKTLPALASSPVDSKIMYLESVPNPSFQALAARVRQFPEEKRESVYKAGVDLLCGAP